MSNEVRIHASVKDDVSQPLTGIKSKIAGIGQEAKGSILTGVGLGAGVSGFHALRSAAEGALKFIGDSIGKASDLNESISKSQVVFGDASKKVQAFGDTAATSIGQSKQAAIEAAATFGNLLETTGVAKDAAADMSISLVKLAGDLASFNNIDPAEALQKLHSGLMGEAEPLRSVGVLLTEGSVAQKAYQMGLAKTGAALTEQQKVQARYALILEQTKTAQGDFARTSTGLANTQRILAAEVDDLSTKIGTALLPVALQLAQTASKDLIPAIGDFAGIVADASGAVSGLVSGLDDLTGHSKGAAESGSILGDVWNGVWDSFSPGSRKAFEIANSMRKVRDAVGTEVAAIPDDMREHERSFADASADLGKAAASGLKSATGEITAAGHAAINTYGDALGGPEGRQKIRANQAIIKREIKTGWVPIDHDALVAGSATSKSFADGLREKRSAIDDAMTQIIEDLKHPLNRGKEIAHDLGLLTSKALARGLKSGDPLIKAEAEAEKDAILARLEELRTQAGPIGRDGMTALGRAIHSKDPYIRGVAQGIWNTVHKQLTKKIDGSSIGSSWVNSIAHGINNSHTQLLRAIANVDGFMAGKSPPKAGPLKGLTGAPIGEWWVRDIAKGINRGMGGLNRTLGAVMPSGVRPSGGAGAPASGGVVLVPVPAHWSPGMQRQFAADAGPALVAWMQQNGHAPRASGR